MSSRAEKTLNLAQRWAARLEVIPKRDQVVLGLGLGQHVTELAKITSCKIFVIDPRLADSKTLEHICTSDQAESSLWDRIHCGTFDEIFPLLQNRRIQVQLFRPCWDRLESEFLQMRDRLNGRISNENRLTTMKDIISKNNEISLLKELVR